MGMIEIRDKDDVVVVSFATVKILDQLAIDQIREEFKDLTLQAASGRKLLLDFSRVQFMSSGMIGQIVQLLQQTARNREPGGRLRTALLTERAALHRREERTIATQNITPTGRALEEDGQITEDP